MFSWFRRRGRADGGMGRAGVDAPAAAASAPTPEVAAAAPRPGEYPTGDVRMTFGEGEGAWSESVNLLELLREAVAGVGVAAVVRRGDLVIEGSGLEVRPVLVGAEGLPDGGVRTTTVTEVRRPGRIDGEVFEYQHSGGDGLANSLRKGFDQWARVDLVTLRDAMLAKPAACMTMEMAFPAADGRGPLTRRGVLGPVAHFVADRVRAPAADDKGGGEGEHEFCPCCLFTNTSEAFKGLVEADGFYAIRFYAARDGEGRAVADCRVNGEDHEAGAAALRAYVARWPERGVEFRKQYVVLQTVEGAASETT